MPTRLSRHEDGSTHTLEAAVMACLMISGIAFAVTYQTLPGASSEVVIAEALERRAHDFLDIAFDSANSPTACLGNTQAEGWIISGISGDNAQFSARKNSTFGAETPTNLILDNLAADMFLARGFRGYGSAAANRIFDPEWNFALALNRTNSVSGVEKLYVEALASLDSHLIAVRGVGLEARVTFDDGNETNKWGWTSLPASADQWNGSVEISILDENADGTLLLPLGQNHVGPTRTEIPITIRMETLFGGPNETSNITAGTSLSVHLPPGWGQPSSDAVDWQASAPVGDEDVGWVQTFHLEDAVPTSSDIQMLVQGPIAPNHPFDVIELDLSHGSLTHAEILVKYPAVPEDGLPRTAYTTVPYPLVPGSDALFGVAVANGGSLTHVTQLDIEIPDGYDLTRLNGSAPELFAGAPTAVGTTGADGSWSVVSPTHVQWRATAAGREIGPNDVSEWLFSIRITDDPAQSTAVEANTSAGVESILTFSNGYQHRSTSWGRAPGVLRHIVPPASGVGEADGYPHTELAAGTSQQYSYDAWVRRAGVNLTTTGTYVTIPDTSDLSSVQNALGNARIELETRKVPLGSVLNVTQDFVSLGEALAAEGVGGFTITTDLYAPATIGCDPVRSWTRNSSTLPLPAIIDLGLHDHDGLGAADVFLIADDKTLYRVNPAGSTTWSTRFDDHPTDLAVGSAGTAGRAVLVGTESGRIHRLDPSGLGLNAWEERVIPSVSPGAELAVREITIDAGNASVLVRTDKTLELREASNGDLIARADLGSSVPLAGSQWWAAAWGDDGYLYAVSTHRVHRLDPASPTLADRDWVPLDEVRGVAATPAGVLVARGIKTHVYDHHLPTEPASTITHNGTQIIRTASGDATNDGVRDLVVVTDTLNVEVVSGATGTIVATYSATLDAFAEVAASVGDVVPDQIYTQGDGVVVDGMHGPPLSTGCDPGATYESVVPCYQIDDPRDAMPVVNALVAKDGQILMGYKVGDIGRVQAWTHGDTVGSEWPIDAPGHASALDLGSQTVIQDVYVVGTTDGKLLVVDPDTGVMSPAVEPSSDVGHFRLRVPIPAGGFYGTHVLITRVGWEDPARGPQEVTLPDWFNVVGEDGVPVLAPVYRLHLAVRDPADNLP